MICLKCGADGLEKRDLNINNEHLRCGGEITCDYEGLTTPQLEPLAVMGPAALTPNRTTSSEPFGVLLDTVAKTVRDIEIAALKDARARLNKRIAELGG